MTNTKALPQIGDCIRIKTGGAERGNQFTIPEGATGIVTDVTADEIWVRMTTHFEVLDEWENKLHITPYSDAETLAEIFHMECEVEIPATEIDRRIDLAFENADADFWVAVVRIFPEITTGDFDPGATFEIHEAMKTAITRWVGWNLPNQGE